MSQQEKKPTATTIIQDKEKMSGNDVVIEPIDLGGVNARSVPKRGTAGTKGIWHSQSRGNIRTKNKSLRIAMQ